MGQHAAVAAQQRHHELWTGTFRTIEQQLARRIQELQHGDPLREVWVVVGSNFLRLYLRRCLARTRPLVNVRFLTLIDLVALLAPECRVANGLQERLAAATAVDAVAATLPGDTGLAQAFKLPGFSDVAGGACQALWEAGIDDLGAILRNVDGQRERAKLKALARVQSELARTFEGASLQRTSQWFQEASSRASRLPLAVRGTTLFVYGFYDFQEQQRRLLAACAQHVNLEFFCPFVDVPSFRYIKPLFEWWRRLGVTEHALSEGSPGEPGPVLFHGHMRPGEEVRGRPPGWDTAGSGGPDSARPRVRFVSAPGEVRELEEVARRIVQLAEEGVPFHEMAVLFRSADTYTPVVAEVFDRAQIPYYLAGGRSLDTTRAGRALVDFVRLASGRFGRAEWVEWFVQSPLVIQAGHRERLATGLWNQVTAEAGIIEGSQEWLSRLEKQVLRYAAELERADEPREEPGVPRSLLADKLEATRTLLDLATTTFNLARELRAASTWADVTQTLGALVEELFDRELSPDLYRAIEALAGLDGLAGPAGGDLVANLVRRAVSQIRMPTGSFQRGRVSVMEVMQARGLHFHTVFVVGVAEHSFPAQARQDALLLDEEREQLNAQVAAWAPGGLSPLPLKARRAEEEELLFALTCSAAAHNLVLTFPRLDASSGQPRLASQFLLRLAQELLSRSVSYEEFEQLPLLDEVPLNQWIPQEPLLDVRQRDLACTARAIHDRAPAALARIVGASPPLRRAIELQQARWGNRQLTAHDGLLRDEGLLRSLNSRHPLHDRPLSATRIETYMTCPYRYFLASVLDLALLEEPEAVSELSALDRGSLYHAILEEFYSRQRDAGRLPVKRDELDVHVRVLAQVAGRHFRRAEAELSIGHALMWELERQQVVDNLTHFITVEAESPDSWIPTRFEWWFGDESGPVELPGREVRFHGRIDRVDRSRSGERVRVTDYKTGSLSRYKADDVQGGETLQLPVYILAASSELGVAPENIVARYAAVTQQGEFRDVGFSGKNWHEVVTTLGAIVDIVQQGIAQGRFFQHPGDRNQNCKYCDFKELCPTAVGTIAVRKEQDPAKREFFAAKGVEVDD